jgi:phospholipid transport system substrate-binding protein
MGRHSTTRAGRGEAGSLVSLVAAALVLLSGGASAAASPASDTIRSFYDALLAVMRQGPALGPQGRYRTLQPVIGRTFDLPFMTRVAVGPAWGSISGTQQKEATDAFGRFVTATYAERVGEQARSADVFVDSRIVKASGEPVAIRYLMRQNGADWQINDVYLDGKISELATRRSEFSSVLRQQGIDGLISTLNRKADALISGPAR